MNSMEAKIEALLAQAEKDRAEVLRVRAQRGGGGEGQNGASHNEKQPNGH